MTLHHNALNSYFRLQMVEKILFIVKIFKIKFLQFLHVLRPLGYKNQIFSDLSVSSINQKQITTGRQIRYFEFISYGDAT